MTTSDERSLESTIIAEISLYVTPSMHDDLRRVYCRRYGDKMLMALFSLYMLAIGTPLIPVKNGLRVSDHMVVAGVVIALTFVGFVRVPLWWKRRYWAELQSTFPETQPQRVTITSKGIRVADGSEMAFRNYYGVMMSDQAVLLFLNKWLVHPFHRSLFATEAEWQAFRTAIRKDGRYWTQVMHGS